MDIKKNFKQMPLLLKILFVTTLYSLVMSIISLIGMKEVNFSYFGSEFPRNYPFIWNLYSVIMGGFGVYVFMKRSYSLLVKYTIVGAVLLVLSLMNSFYSIFGLSGQIQIISAVIIYGITYLFAVLIMIYFLRQKNTSINPSIGL